MAKRPSMDSIQTPDLQNLDKKQSQSLNTFDRYTRAEDTSGKIRADFSRAQVVHDFEISAKKEPEKNEGEQLLEEFSPKRAPKPAEKNLDKGVKFRGKYVAKKKILTAVIVIISLFILAVLFLPPVFKANDSASGCRKEDIFADTGLSQYKTELLENNYVYNIDALSSDSSDSYRICTISFEASNYTPFEVDIEDYAVSGCGSYDDYIVYSAFVGDSNVIPAFSTKTVTIEILVRRDGLTDEQFDEAVTSITLVTKGIRKKLGKSFSFPCIPAWMNVSDVISFNP